ncbi:MAG: type VI secretion system tip protein TssI/VgrG [Polyangiaceae bacterium]
MNPPPDRSDVATRLLTLTCDHAPGLDVRSFSVSESVSGLYAADVVVVTPDRNLPLAAMTGARAELEITADRATRRFRGICASATQLRSSEAALGVGLSTYRIRLVPELWLLGHRTNHRLFQHQSIPEIVSVLLAEWAIECTLDDPPEDFPKLELRTQYGESDLQFVQRLLEEAGVGYVFDAEGEALVLGTRLASAPIHDAESIRFHDQPSPTDRRFARDVVVSEAVGPRAFATSDFDFRAPRRAVRASAEAGDRRLEIHAYRPLASLREGPARAGTLADAKGAARHDVDLAARAAQRALVARAASEGVSFQTNALDLRPGSRVRVTDHPHDALSHALFVTHVDLDGTPHEPWVVRVRARSASVPFVPAQQTPRPTVHGVESATVTGPRGSEIHVDEHGRVKVKFPWDRAASDDEESSTWLRVSQGWSGAGFGMTSHPRVGQEVLVGFLGGNPDAPIVVGRVSNEVNPQAYGLPANKTVSSWRTQSSPATGGYNEIRLEDRAHEEHFYVRAERDFERLVKRDQATRVGRDARADVGRDERKTVGNDQSLDVARDRAQHVGRDASRRVARSDSTVVGAESSLDVGGDWIERTSASHHVSVARDENVRVAGTERRTVGGDGHFVVRGARRDDVGGDLDVRVGGAQRCAVGGALTFQVGGDLHARATGTHALEAESVHVRAGTRLVLEAGARLTLRGPGGFIDFHDGGVDIVGTVVRINSGGEPADGTGIQVAAAGPAEEAAPRAPTR